MLNWVDFTIIGIIALSTIASLFRGFLREFISLIVWVLAVLVALKFSAPLQIHLKPYIASEEIRYLITFIGLFIIVLIIGMFVNLLIKLLVKKTGVGFMDRFFGVFFGLGRGVLIVSVLLMLANISFLRNSEAISKSATAPYFKPIVTWLDQYLPKQLHTVSKWLNISNIDHEVNP